jgi:hypothetical protein
MHKTVNRFAVDYRGPQPKLSAAEFAKYRKKIATQRAQRLHTTRAQEAARTLGVPQPLFLASILQCDSREREILKKP